MAKITKIVKNTTILQIEEDDLKGVKFSFKYKIADATTTVSDPKAKKGNDAWEPEKNFFHEGEYKKQKEEKKEDKRNK